MVIKELSNNNNMQSQQSITQQQQWQTANRKQYSTMQ